MADDDVYIDEMGRRRLGPRPFRPESPVRYRPGYASPLWPPPGHLAAAHRPECGIDGRGCVCREEPSHNVVDLAEVRRSRACPGGVR